MIKTKRNRIIGTSFMALSILFISSLAAQVDRTLVGGVNLGNIQMNSSDYDAILTSKMKTGFSVGMERKVGPLIIGAGVVQRGSTFEFDFGPDGQQTIPMIFNYLNVYSLYPYSPFNHLTLLGGFQVGQFLNGTIGDEKDTINKDEVSIDYGAIVGLGYFFTSQVGLRATYYRGLADIGKSGPSKDNMKHTGIGITLLLRY
jgi:hypothetical protein